MAHQVAASSPTRTGPREPTEVLVQDGRLDLPASAEPHVWDRVLDDRLAQCRPRDPNVLRCLLAGQPDCGTGGARPAVVSGWPPVPEIDDSVCDRHVGSRLRAGSGEPADK